MCGRFALNTSAEDLGHLFHVEGVPSLPRRYNVAPSQQVAAIRKLPGESRSLAMLKWGLTPFWAKEEKIGARMINARSEEIATKPAFRDPFRKRRCLIPADGFYEWDKVRPGEQPWFIRLRERRPMAFAGLWDRWRSPEGKEIESCTILTTAANEVVAPIHDRMPVILSEEFHDLWLDSATLDAAALTPLLHPFPADAMEAYAVSRGVNSPRNDDPRCIEPV